MTHVIRQHNTTWTQKGTLTGRAKSRLLSAAVFAVLTLPLVPTIAFADEDIKRIGIMLYDGVLTSDVVAPMEVFGVAIANEMMLA